MIGILLLVGLTSSVCGFVVRKTLYSADEGDNVTLSWERVTNTDISLTSMVCVHSVDLKVLYELIRGVEVLKNQHPQFAGRVRCDEDALRDGRVSLHMSRVTTNDAGKYWCDLMFEDDTSERGRVTMTTSVSTLNVSSRRETGDELLTAKPEGSEDAPQESKDNTVWFPVLLLVFILLCLILCPLAGIVFSFPSAAQIKTFSSSRTHPGLRRSSSSEPLQT